MAFPATVRYALFLATILCTLRSGVHGTPAELDRRLVCNQDNCLRALLANSGTAGQFCDAYLDNLYSTTATYTKPCTENPTAVSTACSCFLSIQATSTTSTKPTATPTPTQCLQNYGYKYNEYAFSFKSQYIFFNGGNYFAPQGSCCIKCFNTPGCYSYSENLITGSNPTETYCELGTVAGGTWPGVSAQCPLGKATGPDNGVFQPQPSPGFNYSGGGLGPCGAG